jgi:uncharacterized protein (DUF488 family)
MSKYINTEELHKVVLKRKAEYGSLADLIDNIVESMVKETPYADVVEKEKIDRAIKRITKMAKSYEKHDEGVYAGLCLALMVLQNELRG